MAFKNVYNGFYELIIKLKYLNTTSLDFATFD